MNRFSISIFAELLYGIVYSTKFSEWSFEVNVLIYGYNPQKEIKKKLST